MVAKRSENTETEDRAEDVAQALPMRSAPSEAADDMSTNWFFGRFPANSDFLESNWEERHTALSTPTVLDNR